MIMYVLHGCVGETQVIFPLHYLNNLQFFPLHNKTCCGKVDLLRVSYLCRLVFGNLPPFFVLTTVLESAVFQILDLTGLHLGSLRYNNRY